MRGEKIIRLGRLLVTGDAVVEPTVTLYSGTAQLSVRANDPRTRSLGQPNVVQTLRIQCLELGQVSAPAAPIPGQPKQRGNRTSDPLAQFRKLSPGVHS